MAKLVFPAALSPPDPIRLIETEIIRKTETVHENAAPSFDDARHQATRINKQKPGKDLYLKLAKRRVEQNRVIH